MTLWPKSAEITRCQSWLDVRLNSRVRLLLTARAPIVGWRGGQGFTVRRGRKNQIIHDHCQFHIGPGVPDSMLPGGTGRAAPATGVEAVHADTQMSLFGGES